MLTDYAKQGMSSGTTIDLVWANQQADDLLVACLVDAEESLSHHSHHKAIVTVISKKCDDVKSTETNPLSTHAWHKTNQPKFTAKLKALLPPPSLPLSHSDIASLNFTLVSAITTSLNWSSPVNLTNSKQQAWWNPTILTLLCQKAARARKKTKSHSTDETQETYHSHCNKYFHAINREKTNSWCRYLCTLQVDTLFKSKRHVVG